MDKPIRILQIVPNMQMGGLETFIMNIYRNIDKEKIKRLTQENGKSKILKKLKKK